MGKPKKWDALTDIAAEQYGLFTTRQAESVGYRRDALVSMVQRGIIIRPRRGIYQVKGTAVDRFSPARETWLSLTGGEDPDLVISHYFAAELWDLGQLGANVYDFTHPTWRPRRTFEYEIHEGVVPVSDRTYLDGICLTTPRRTVVDVAAAGIDGDHFGRVIVDAVLKYGVDVEDLALALDDIAPKYGFRRGQQYIASCVRVAPDNLYGALKLVSLAYGDDPSNPLTHSPFDSRMAG